MLHSLRIERYRRFKTLELTDLARVNLLVGQNNVGKSSVLEAVGILMSPSAYAPWSAAWRRAQFDDQPPAIGGLCHGFTFSEGAGFDVSGLIGAPPEAGDVDLRARLGVNLKVLRPPAAESDDVAWHARVQRFERGEKTVGVGQFGEVRGGEWRREFYRERQLSPAVNMLTVRPAHPAELARLLSDIMLTAHESNVLAAMQIVDPRVLRVAPHIKPDNGPPDVRVQIEGAPTPVALSNLGEGSARMLSIALALTTAAGGFALFDEVDTGLHHSVMDDMWRMVLQTAKALDVQVFATTHDDDCWQSLGRVAGDGDARLLRLEEGGVVPYSSAALQAAAETETEVR